MRIVDTSCDWTRFIRPSKADALTDDLKRQIVAHNEIRERRCRK